MLIDELLQSWAEESRRILRSASGRIAADDVATLTRVEKTTVENLLTRMLPIARSYARPPISNYHVGAVALGTSGSIYLGTNIEFGGNALNQTVHGEQAAVANAFGNRDRGISAIAVTAAPCGHCRQFLNEITDGSRIRIVVAGQPVRTLADLLPASFGPRDLGIAAGMSTSPPAQLRLASESDDPAVKSALEAASRAYAPYSKAPSGCAVTMASGRTFTGSYLENAAFNPSLSPLQSALVNVLFAGEDFAAIRRVVLVELKNAVISQRPATEAVLGAVAAGARVDLFFA